MAQEVTAGPGWRRTGPPETAVRRRLRWPLLGATTYAIAQAVLLFWWAARYPGLFSPDSLDYIWQSTTGNWNTHHPISYTALVWLSLQLTGGVGALTLAQTALAAAGLAYAVTGLRRLGGPGWGWSVAAVTVVALPPVGTFVVCVWKDVPFVLCHLFLLGTVARLLARRRSGATPALSRTPLAVLLVELTLICLFRQNGFVVVAVTTGLLALLLRGAAVRITVAGLAAAMIALSANWLLLPALGVRDSESIVAHEAFLSDIALSYAEHPAGFPAADLTLLATIAPLEHWRRSADCFSVDPTVYHPDFDRRAAAAHRDELLAVWWRAARRTPGTVLAARLCRGSIAWRPTPTGGLRGNPTAWALPIYLDRDPRLRQSPFRDAVYSRPLDDRIAAAADLLAARVNRPEWLLWRGATWAYLAYLVVGVVAWRRRDRSLLALATLSAGNQVSVLVFNAAQAARYMAAPLVLGVLLLPLLAARRPDPADPDPAGPGAGGPGRPGTVRSGWRGGRPDGPPALRVTDLTVAVGSGPGGLADEIGPADRAGGTGGIGTGGAAGGRPRWGWRPPGSGGIRPGWSGVRRGSTSGGTRRPGR